MQINTATKTAAEEILKQAQTNEDLKKGL